MTKRETLSEHNPDNQPRLSRLFHDIAMFGIFYTVGDVAGTLGNHIHTANSVEIPPDKISALSAIAAGLGTIVMDRFYKHNYLTEQPQETIEESIVEN